jgi:peptidyl-prolyl cis-trans isomerase SurA
MKRLYIFILSLVTVAGLSAQVADDPVLMTVNGKEILRSEFEYAFNKNRGNIADSAMTAEEYLQMYIDFKLKVVEAEALGLDTLESFKTEYAKDRSQLAESYLTDPNYVDDEAYRIYAKDSATIGKDGFVQVAHVFFPANQKENIEMVRMAAARADSAYAMICAGASFEETADFFAVPRQSILPFEIIKGQAYKEFEDVAYMLKDGEYSEPFESPAGFHIVKRFSSRPFGNFEEYRPAIIKMLERENIYLRARMKRGFDLAKEFGGNMTPQEALAREDSMLESKYPEFGSLMREYYDGLLFFEVSTREVWDKSSNDEAGLNKFFKKNKKRYLFESPRYRGAVIHANSPENLDMMKNMLAGKHASDYKAVIEENLPKDSAHVVRVEIGIFAIGDNAWIDKCVFNQGDGGEYRKGYNFVDVIGQVIPAPETYKDVKVAVQNDYQKFLEEKWVKGLRKKYKVSVDKKVLKTVNNHN